MKKSVFAAFLLILVLMLSAPASASESYPCGDNLTAVLYDGGMLVITGTGSMKDYSPDGDMAPWGTGVSKIAIGSGVKSIGSYAFYECENLTSVIIPANVEKIGYEAFESCTGITNLILEDGIANIDDLAFARCSGLKTLTVPDSVRKIGTAAFYECTGLKNVSLGSGLYSLGSNAFYGCTGLTSMTVPKGVRTLEHVFPECTNLREVTIEEGVAAIGQSTFWDCTGLVSITLPKSVSYIGNSAFSGCTGLREVNLQEGLSEIGDFAFYDCTSLTSVAIPAGVASIGEVAFSGCTKLESVSVPKSVTSIGLNAFQNTPWLASLQKQNPLVIVNNVLLNADYVSGDVVIPDNVEKIGEYTFVGNDDITSVTIGDGVTRIDDMAFLGCGNLKTVTFGKGLTRIGNRAFSRCAGLTSVGVPANVTCIKDYTFLTSGADPEIVVIYPVEGITLECDELLLKEGEQRILTAEISPANAWDKRILWKSSDPASISVEDGKITVLKAGIATITATSVDGGFEAKCLVRVPVTFEDVDADAYYAGAVWWAVLKHITSGTSQTTFSPDMICTRGQCVTFFYRAAGEPSVEGINNPFRDINPGSYYYNAVLWARSKGITSGTSEKTFSPESECTRSQIVTFLWRFAGEPYLSAKNTFSDIDLNQYYGDAVRWAAVSGITSGTSQTTFSPDMPCTRAQIVTFLQRYFISIGKLD